MTPLVTAPNRGYSDWQRVSNYDTAPLFSANTGLVALDSTGAAPLDVSRFAYLGGLDNVTANPAHVTMQWFADAAGTVSLGVRNFVLHNSIANGAQYRIQNLGPFVTVTWTATGGNFQHVCELVGSNRVYPLEFIAPFPQLIANANAAIGANQNLIVWPSGYTIGPVKIWHIPPAAGAFITVRSYDTSGTPQTIEQYQVAGGAQQVFTTIIPAGAWNVAVLNSGAAGTYYLSATPSMTGGA